MLKNNKNFNLKKKLKQSDSGGTETKEQGTVDTYLPK